MARPNTTTPDLVADLRDIQNRLDALERRPVPQTVFDQYPTTEWEAVGRDNVYGNIWTSCGIANVTGLKYDRVEVKYITDAVIKGRSEAEIRLAAFRHEYGSQFKKCVSATSVMHLTGETAGTVCVGKWRWIHSIQFGWDYTDEDNAVYTIELQHRYPNGMQQKPDKPPVMQMYGFMKMSDQNASWSGGLLQGDGANNTWAPGLRPANGGVPAYGWVDVQDRDSVWDGSHRISNMHYCVGMPQERLPDASVEGWHWYTGSSRVGRAGNVNEEYLQF
ncbi:hypothetical protein [Streptomyces chrestomyceticus]|uniref:hypothetical protein n=1 Tax=Streptomyces chrestomyceticus TaxID=68185 RepID=UPI0037A34282